MVPWGLGTQCRLVHGDCRKCPFEAEEFDSAYAIYAFKYFVDLKPVFQEVHRVLKPNGLFLIYDLVKTPQYDSANFEHEQLVAKLEHCCGMPPLHSNAQLIEAARYANLKVVCQMDIQSDSDLPWYQNFIENRFFYWAMGSSALDFVLGLGEKVGIVPAGFQKFKQIFLGGIVTSLVQGGQKGIISGSNILVFQKD